MTLLAGGHAASAATESPTTRPASPETTVRVVVEASESPSTRAGMMGVPGALLEPVGGFAESAIEQRRSTMLQVDMPPTRGSGPPMRGESVTMVGLLRGTDLVNAAADRALSVGPAEVTRYVRVRPQALGAQTVLLEVQLRRRDGDAAWPDDAARRLESELVRGVTSAYEQSTHVGRSARERGVQPLREEIERSERRLLETRASLTRVANANDPELGDPRQALQMLRGQQLAARRELNSTRAQLQRLAPTEAGDDEKELQDQLGREYERHESLRRADANDPEIIRVMAEIERLNRLAEMARRNAPVRPGVDPNQIDGLRDALRRQEAHSADLQERIARLEDPQLAALIARREILQQDEQRLLSRYAQLRSQLDQAEAVETIPLVPTISVIDGLPLADDAVSPPIGSDE